MISRKRTGSTLRPRPAAGTVPRMADAPDNRAPAFSYGTPQSYPWLRIDADPVGGAAQVAQPSPAKGDLQERGRPPVQDVSPLSNLRR